MYPDSPKLFRASTRVYTFVCGLLIIITGRSILPVIVSAQVSVVKKEITDKEVFDREHRHYRIVKWAYEQGHFVTKHQYYCYALIAKKYNWPYIKEVYDND